MNKTVFEEGPEERMQNIVLRLGGKRFGPPSDEIENQIRAIQDHARLEALIERIIDVRSWEELFNG